MITCASKLGPGSPRSITRSGAAACTTQEHFLQLNLGRTWRMTKKLAGTYSNISDESSPNCATRCCSRGTWCVREDVFYFAPQMRSQGAALARSSWRLVLSGWWLLRRCGRLRLDHASVQTERQLLCFMAVFSDFCP